MSVSDVQRNIVVIGGGIIGCTYVSMAVESECSNNGSCRTAYYLSRHPSFSPSTIITVLEASKVGAAQGASGKVRLSPSSSNLPRISPYPPSRQVASSLSGPTRGSLSTSASRSTPSSRRSTTARTDGAGASSASEAGRAAARRQTLPRQAPSGRAWRRRQASAAAGSPPQNRGRRRVSRKISTG